MNIEIKEAQELPTQIQTLAKHAAQEGFDFVHRLIEEWESGKNRFNQPGEFLLFVYDGDQLVACGGLNQQWNAFVPAMWNFPCTNGFLLIIRGFVKVAVFNADVIHR